MCVDSGSKRKSHPWSLWDCVDQMGGASSEPSSQGCGAPGSLLCAVCPRAPRQAISPCPVFALEVGDVGKCGLQGPHHLTCAGSPALGSQAEALVSPGDGLALWPWGWECADGQTSGGFAGRVGTKVCFLLCLEPNASAWERVNLPSEPVHPFPATSSNSRFLQLKARCKIRPHRPGGEVEYFRREEI